ncbi:hypothetical protein SKAU_G00266440 [Synaphobranchus kaupii]|uniref:Uncharacterized protein n=1 Tax=Synaphobranchus kaupii TaxID=118154 RepID=A0A9Q1EZD9_SYNKA|nr:hypothetical protein SKAU_G00266440 [Synaphobranchus kaupii]
MRLTQSRRCASGIHNEQTEEFYRAQASLATGTTRQVPPIGRTPRRRGFSAFLDAGESHIACFLKSRLAPAATRRLKALNSGEAVALPFRAEFISIA